MLPQILKVRFSASVIRTTFMGLLLMNFLFNSLLKRFSIGIALLFVVPLVAFAANNQTFDGAEVSVGGNTYVLNGNADQLVVNQNDFAIVLSPGGSVTVTSSDKKILTNTLGRKTTCGSASSSTTLDWPATESSSFEVTVTPSSTSCTTDEGGGTISSGGGGGGGGGGGSTAPAPAPAVKPTTASIQDKILEIQKKISSLQTGAPTGTPPAFGVFTKNLRPGLKNDEVMRLQELLARDKTIYPEGIVSGFYGPKTTAAVKRFQKKYGISQVGVVGPLTRAKLNEVFGSGIAQPEVKKEVETPAPKPVAPVPASTPVPTSAASSDQLKAIQDQIKALQAKILEAQIKAIQDKINSLKK